MLKQAAIKLLLESLVTLPIRFGIVSTGWPIFVLHVSGSQEL